MNHYLLIIIGRPSRVKHMQDDEYDYEASADYQDYNEVDENESNSDSENEEIEETLNAFFNEKTEVLEPAILKGTEGTGNKDFFDSSFCRQHLSSYQGEIFTPGFRNEKPEYPSNLNCEWEIEAPPNHHVELEFVHFKLEYHRNCKMDRVEIHHDGQGFFLCGSGIPGRNFVSEGPNMKVNYTRLD